MILDGKEHEAPLKDICFFFKKRFHLVVNRVEYMDALLGFWNKEGFSNGSCDWC